MDNLMRVKATIHSCKLLMLGVASQMKLTKKPLPQKRARKESDLVMRSLR